MKQWDGVRTGRPWRVGVALWVAVTLGLAVMDDAVPGGVPASHAWGARRRGTKSDTDDRAKKKRTVADVDSEDEDDWGEADEEAPKKKPDRAKAAAKASRWTATPDAKKPAEATDAMKTMSAAELWAEGVRLFEMGQYKDAATFFDVFAMSNPPNEVLLALQRKHGMGYLIRLHAKEAVRPAAAEIAKLLRKATEQATADPQAVAQVVELLGGNVADRALAMARLKIIGVRALPALLVAVARRRDTAFSTHVVRAIRYMGFDAVPPLVAVLDSRNAKMVGFALMVLDDLGHASAVPWIRALQQDPKRLAHARSRAETVLQRIMGKPPEHLPSAKAMLLAEARIHYHRRYDPLEDRSTVWIWSWSDKAGLSWRDLPGEAAADWLALDACRRAYKLAPQDLAVQVMYVCAALAQDEPLAPDDPWHRSAPSARSLAQTLNGRLLSACLKQAMQDGKHRVALRLCEILGQVASEEALRASAPDPTPLALALQFPDRRIQFQAALSIARIRPRRPFPGSRNVIPVLLGGLRRHDKLRTLIIDAAPPRAAELRSRWQKLGWDAQVATSSADARRTLDRSPPFDLICVRADLKRPGPIEVVQMLRGHERARPVYVLVIVTLDQRRALGAMLARVPRVGLWPSGTTPEQFATRARDLIGRLGLTPLDPKQAVQLAATVMDTLLDFARDGACPFEITLAQEAMIDALADPVQAPMGARVLGFINTSKAQGALCDKALNATTGPDLKPVLLSALANSLRWHASLLPPKQSRRLVQRMLALKDPNLRPLGLTIVSLSGPDPKVDRGAFDRLRPAERKATPGATP